MPSKWHEKKARQAEMAAERELQAGGNNSTEATEKAAVRDAAMGKGDDELFEKKLSKEEKKALAKAKREAKKAVSSNKTNRMKMSCPVLSYHALLCSALLCSALLCCVCSSKFMTVKSFHPCWSSSLSSTKSLLVGIAIVVVIVVTLLIRRPSQTHSLGCSHTPTTSPINRPRVEANPKRRAKTARTVVLPWRKRRRRATTQKPVLR